MDIEFESLHLEISLEKNGTVVDSADSYVENWKPGEKTTFEFYTDASFDKIVIKKLRYFKY